MKKGWLVFSICLVILFLIFITAAKAPLLVEDATTLYSPLSEKSCSDNTCSVTLYSYEKYFNRNGEWEPIDETFFDCSSRGQTKFCTKDYYFEVSADDEGLITAILDGEQLQMQLSGLLNLPLTFTPSAEEGSLTYKDVVPGIDLRYQYSARKLKEEIIIKEPLQNIVQPTLPITFAIEGDANFILEEPYICDNNGACIFLESELTGNELRVDIPTDFLINSEHTYPMIIDPTISLNHSYTWWNGWVEYNTAIPNYSRVPNPRSIELGLRSASVTARGDIEWDLSAIPDQSDIYNATMTLFVESTTGSRYINLTHMEKNNSGWSGDATGNMNFYIDMANGSSYGLNSSTISANSYINFNFNQQGVDAVNNSLPINLLSIGLDADFGARVVVSGRDNTNASRRPQLTIVYGVNASSAGAAIEQGIGNSLPANPVSSGQQVYVVGLNDQHYFGRFDKTTTKNNQTWLFNYVSAGESFITMPSLFNIVNVWQNQSLNFTEIVSQVELFINNTRLP